MCRNDDNADEITIDTNPISEKRFNNVGKDDGLQVVWKGHATRENRAAENGAKAVGAIGSVIGGTVGFFKGGFEGAQIGATAGGAGGGAAGGTVGFLAGIGYKFSFEMDLAITCDNKGDIVVKGTVDAVVRNAATDSSFQYSILRGTIPIGGGQFNNWKQVTNTKSANLKWEDV